MPVIVKCTACNLELSAPDNLVGKHATCPKCRARLPVLGTPVAASSIKVAAVPPPAPTTAAKGAVAQFTGGATATAQSPPAATPGTQSAKFIIADATARRLELGAGGQLPKLALDEEQKKEVPEEQTSGSKTWLLLLAVAGSVGISVAMMFFDVSGWQGESSEKVQARRIVVEYVEKLSAKEPVRRCQPLLAEAIQAYNRGDIAKEQECYRRVLDMLHAEGNDPNEGITGAVRTSDPNLPNDTELERQLKILRR